MKLLINVKNLKSWKEQSLVLTIFWGTIVSQSVSWSLLYSIALTSLLNKSQNSAQTQLSWQSCAQDLGKALCSSSRGWGGPQGTSRRIHHILLLLMSPRIHSTDARSLWRHVSYSSRWITSSEPLMIYILLILGIFQGHVRGAAVLAVFLPCLSSPSKSISTGPGRGPQTPTWQV